MNTNKAGLKGFQFFLHSCTFDESSLIIERVKLVSVEVEIGTAQCCSDTQGPLCGGDGPQDKRDRLTHTIRNTPTTQGSNRLLPTHNNIYTYMLPQSQPGIW